MNEMTFVKLLFISIRVFDGVHLVKLSLPGYSWLFKVRPLLPHFLKTIVSINFFPWSMSAAWCEGQGRGRVKVGEKARGHILPCTAAFCATTYTSNLLQIQDVWLDGKVKLFSQAFAPIKLRTCEIGVISNWLFLIINAQLHLRIVPFTEPLMNFPMPDLCRAVCKVWIHLCENIGL